MRFREVESQLYTITENLKQLYSKQEIVIKGKGWPY